MKEAGETKQREGTAPPSAAPKLGPEGRNSMRGESLAEKAPAKDAAKSSGSKDVAKPAEAREALSPEQKQWLRDKTPDPAVTERINDVPASKKVDPVYGYKVKTLEADHIVPFKTICELPGFSTLDREQQREVVNYPPNFQGLGRYTNASKSDKSWADWKGHPSFGAPPNDLRRTMIQRENKLLRELQSEIDKKQAQSTR
jgi:hypothetical protein